MDQFNGVGSVPSQHNWPTTGPELPVNANTVDGVGCLSQQDSAAPPTCLTSLSNGTNRGGGSRALPRTEYRKQ